MQREISVTLTNCRLDLCLLTVTEKRGDVHEEHDFLEILKQFDARDGLTISLRCESSVPGVPV